MTHYLSIEDVAELAGVSPATIRSYRARGYLPAPDIVLGQSPGWTEKAIRQWLTNRPGRGIGGGRPRKDQG